MGSDGGTGDLGSGSLSKEEGSCGDDMAVDETCDPSDRGLIPRICSSLFSRMKTEGKKMEETTYRTEVKLVYKHFKIKNWNSVLIKLRNFVIRLSNFSNLGKLPRNLQ